MPNRIIKESIKSSPNIDRLTWFDEVVFYRLIVSADDFGRFDGRPTVIKNTLFPTKENVTRKAIEDAVSDLVSAGLLCRYTVSGMPYVRFPTWERHQRIRNKHCKFPDPEGDFEADGDLTANCCQMTADCMPESESNQNQNPNPSGRARAARFTPPTLAEVQAYVSERHSPVDAQEFLDFYASKGWMVGKTPMKDWKAACRNAEKWERWRKKPGKEDELPGAGGAGLDEYQLVTTAEGRREWIRKR